MTTNDNEGNLFCLKSNGEIDTKIVQLNNNNNNTVNVNEE